jgi:hypothetical protein
MALDDDLGACRHLEIHRQGAHQRHRCAAQAAGNLHLVGPLRASLHHRGEQHGRIDAERHGDFQRPARGLGVGQES